MILSYLAFTTAVILGWWNSLPEAPLLPRLPHRRRCAARLRSQTSQPHVLGFSELVPAALRSLVVTRKWRCSSPRSGIPMPTSGLPISTIVFGALIPRSGSNASTRPLLTELLQIAYTLFIPAVLLVAVASLAPGPFRRVPVLCVPDRAGVPGLVHRLPAGSRARPAISAAVRATHFRSRACGSSSTCRALWTRLESAHYDCFPSGHTELTILAWWGSRMVSQALVSALFLSTLRSSFLLQFIFDITIRSTCWRASP